MNIGKACAIFENINSDKYTEQEKLLAIHAVIEMETHNSITKDNIIKAFRWLWNWFGKQPTDYDIDKIVSELNDSALEFELFGQCNDYVEISHAIEIVKGGIK